MSYTAPYIDSAGLHIPTYSDILEDLIAKTKGIYGLDIYLEKDSADYQLLSVFAKKTYDTMLSIQLAYNSRGPLTAIGSALDGVVKLNGLTRKASSYSTVDLTLSGTPGTVIYNGVVQDSAGYKWDLPATVTISGLGTVTASATCETIGAIAATAGTVTTIATPTAGWTGVTNAAAASLGQPIEQDSELRTRQGLSTTLPSQTLFSGTIAAIAALSGVTRYKCYENFTNITDSNGLDPHSIWAVVEGGTEEDIAEAIYYNKSPGCGVNGTTTVVVTDPDYGNSVNIKFSRPDYVTIYANIGVKILTGGTTALLVSIQDAVIDYVNALQIGEDLTLSGIYGAIMATMPNLLAPIFSIQSLEIGDAVSPMGTTDVVIPFDSVTYAATSPKTIVVTQVY